MKWWGWALLGTAGVVVGREAWHELALHRRRGVLYAQALERARALGKPLLVIGAPTAGVVTRFLMPSYGCGSVLLDTIPCPDCELQICGPLLDALRTMDDGQFVVFVGHGLEDAPNLVDLAVELDRVSGGHLFIAHRHHATLVALLADRNRIRTAPPDSGIVRYIGPGAGRATYGVIELPRTQRVRRALGRGGTSSRAQQAVLVDVPPTDYIDVPAEG